MKKNIVVLAISVLLLVVLSACSASTENQIPTQITVNGTGKVYLIPDTAYISIGVHTEAPVVTDALDENNRQAQAIASTLAEYGVAAEDVQTSAFNVYPMQEYGPMGEVTNVKYAVDNSVMVTVRDLSSFGKLLDAIVQSGANTINSISFDAQDKESALTEARRLAVEDARKQAEDLAVAAGVKVGRVLSISAYSSGPMPAYDVKAYSSLGGGQVPVAAGQIVITIDANVIFDID